jgi:hypothetical protein
MRSRKAVGHGQNKKVEEKNNDAKTARQRHGTLKMTHANIVMSE